MCSTAHTTRQFKQPVFSIKVQYVLRRQRKKNKLRFCTEESWDACFNFSLLHSPASELSCSHSLSPFMVKQLCLGEAFPRVGRKRRDSAAPPFHFWCLSRRARRGSPRPRPSSPAGSRPGAVVPLLASPEQSKRWLLQVPQGPV